MSFLTRCYWVHHWDERNQILCYWNRYDFVMFSKRTNDFRIEFLSKYWVWEIEWIWRIDLRFEFEMLSTSSSMLKKSDWFVWWADIISKISQKSRMIQILIWDCRYWRFCWKIDWFSDSNIDAITVARNRDRFVMISKYVFESNLEQIKWFQCRCSEKKFHWYDDSESDF